MDCNRLYPSRPISAQKQHKVGVGKDAYYLGAGMSKSFRQFLNTLLIANQFPHQIEK
jgi:hypothetical protein